MIKNEKLIISIHEAAKKVSQEVRSKESELLIIIQKIDQFKVYRAYNYPSLFKYLILSLGFSEQRAYEYIAVSRAGVKFSKLQEAINHGSISISKARRITPVLNNSNQEHWLKIAKLNTHRNLEKLVAGVNPELALTESVRPVSANQVEVRMIMTQSEYNDFKRAQDILCQKRKKQVSLKNTLHHINLEFLKREDPVILAIKHQEQKIRDQAVGIKKKTIKKQEESGMHKISESLTAKGLGTAIVGNKSRKSIPAIIFHQVQLRDRGSCQEHLPNGEKCQESKWTNIHHIKPVCHGGGNNLENLVTLCRGHHQLEHWKGITSFR